MGMFDSFMIQIDGHPVEVQTKRFDQSLAQLRPGDVVSGALPGVRVYFDRLRLDAHHRVVYADTAEGRHYTLFIVLVNSVFTTYEVVDGDLEAAVIQQRIDSLKATWNDSARVMAQWVEFLSERQHAVADLQSRIHHTLSLIDYARRPRTEAALVESQLFPRRKDEERIDNGEDLLDVLHSALKNAAPESWLGGTPRIVDALDEFRL